MYKSIAQWHRTLIANCKVIGWTPVGGSRNCFPLYAIFSIHLLKHYLSQKCSWSKLITWWRSYLNQNIEVLGNSLVKPLESSTWINIGKSDWVMAKTVFKILAVFNFNLIIIFVVFTLTVNNVYWYPAVMIFNYLGKFFDDSC